MSQGSGEAIIIAAGQFAVLKEQQSAVIVDNVIVDGQNGAARIDVRVGDRIVALQDTPTTRLTQFTQAYRAISAGTSVTLRVSRPQGEVVLRFPKPEERGDQRLLVVGGADKAAPGAWATASSETAKSFVVAGANFKENSEGMPEVSYRTAHPAAATLALRVGDVVTAVNGRSIAALAGLELIYNAEAPGTRMRFTVRRGDTMLDVDFVKPADK